MNSLKKYLGLKLLLQKCHCNTDEFSRSEKRPEYSVLNNYMLELTTEDITRNWKEAIGEYLK